MKVIAKIVLLPSLFIFTIVSTGCAQNQNTAPAPTEQALGKTANGNAPVGSDATVGARSPASPSPAPSPSPAATKAPAAFLGVVVTVVPALLRAQLSGVLPAQPGALIQSVQKGSAAATAGVQQYDVVTAIDNEAIGGPVELVERIRQLKPGQKIALQIIRAGAKQTLTATLGQAAAPTSTIAFDELRHLKIEKSAPDKLTVEFRFEDASGATVERSFSGARSDVERQIREDKDLTDARKSYLLDNLQTVAQSRSGALERGSWSFSESPEHRRLREMHDWLFDSSSM